MNLIDHLQDLIFRQEPLGHGRADFIQYDQVISFRMKGFQGRLEAFPGSLAVLGERRVVRRRYKAPSHLDQLDTRKLSEGHQFAGGCVGLDELENQGSKAVTGRAERHTEGSSRFSLAITSKNQDAALSFHRFSF